MAGVRLGVLQPEILRPNQITPEVNASPRRNVTQLPLHHLARTDDKQRSLAGKDVRTLPACFKAQQNPSAGPRTPRMGR